MSLGDDELETDAEKVMHLSEILDDVYNESCIESLIRLGQKIPARNDHCW